VNDVLAANPQDVLDLLVYAAGRLVGAFGAGDEKALVAVEAQVVDAHVVEDSYTLPVDVTALSEPGMPVYNSDELLFRRAGPFDGNQVISFRYSTNGSSQLVSGLDNLSIKPWVVIPEPATAGLIGIAAGLLGARPKRPGPGPAPLHA